MGGIQEEAITGTAGQMEEIDATCRRLQENAEILEGDSLGYLRRRRSSYGSTSLCSGMEDHEVVEFEILELVRLAIS